MGDEGDVYICIIRTFYTYVSIVKTNQKTTKWTVELNRAFGVAGVV